MVIRNAKNILAAVLMLASATKQEVAQAQQINFNTQVRSPFPLSAVRLNEGPFLAAQQRDLEYIMSLDPDRLLAPYLREAGLTPKKESYGNWENTGLDGHIGGHYLTALSLMYASTGNQAVLDRLNYMLAELKRCQDKNGNGYIGGVPGGLAMWNDIAAGKIDAGAFSLNHKWVPWYNIHKLYAGLRDAYVFTGNEQAKTMLLNLSGWSMKLLSGLSDAQIQEMLKSEHGGMNEIFADVAAFTGDQKYLELAKRFSDRRILNPLEEERDQLNGLHANTQIPKVIGFERIGELANDPAYRTAARFFWETVVHNRTSVIGGNSVREHFHPSTDFSSMVTDVQGPETCNSYNMLKLSKMLFEAEGKADYVDYYERTLYNHILSTQHPTGGGLVYFTPLRPDHYRVYSSPQESFWCCVGSGMENHAKYGELIYSHTKDALFVNLFIASTLDWKEKGVKIVQRTQFPFSEQSEITIGGKPGPAFAVNLRYPAWVKAGALKVKVNGKEEPVKGSPGSYISLQRKWNAGDRIVVTMPMSTTVEDLPDHSGFVAVLRGPIVLAAKMDSTDMKGLVADGSRMGHIASGSLAPLKNAPFLLGDKSELASQIRLEDPQKLTFNAASVIYPASYAHHELMPFFMVHDSRYTIYWPWATRATLAERQKKLAEMDEVKERLAEITVDQVSPGEQQPESDHFFEGEKTETGVFKDRHYRQAKGWFSYRLTNRNKNGKVLRVTYFSADQPSAFDILVNGVKINTAAQPRGPENQFYQVDLAIPELALKDGKETMIVKFQAKDGAETARVFDVRLIRK